MGVIKYLVTADWHLTNSNPKFRKGPDGVSDLLKAQRAYAIEHLGELLATKEYHGLLNLGDYVDQATLSPLMQYYSNNIFSDLNNCKDVDDKFVNIEGNHCITDKNMSYTVLSAMAPELKHATEGTHVAIQQQTISDNPRPKLEVLFHCFPYQSDYRELEKQIAAKNDVIRERDDEADRWQTVHVMLFHFPTKNALLDNGMKAATGVNLSEEITCNFDICLGGDYHKRQQISPNAWYVGAPFDLKFGEHYRRGTMVLEIDDDANVSVSTIDNPYQYDLIKMDVEEFLSQDWPRADRTVAQVTGEASGEQMSKLDQMKPDFYRLTTAVNRGAKVDKDELDVDVVEDIGQKDVDLIRAQMRKAGIKAPVIKRAVEIFESKIQPTEEK